MKLSKILTLAMLLGVALTMTAQNDYDNAPLDILPYSNPNYSLLRHDGVVAKGKSVNGEHVGQRPDHWNNGIMKCFRPTFNQDRGSCGSAAAICYQFAHEWNAYRDLDGSLMENKYPSHFTWLTTYSHSDKRQIERHVGVPTAAVYGGDTYSNLFGSQDYHSNDYGWMQGYDKWYSAMFNRLINAYSFPISIEGEEGREALKYWLWNHNGDTEFVAGGIANVGAASGLTQSDIPSTATNKSIGVSGMKYISMWGATYDHSLSIVGYDDRIEFDLDGNGVYGERDKDELGAWIIANSWGNGWANKGFIYCPYKYGGPWLPRADKSKEFFKPTVYFIRKNYRPLRTLKILMDYSVRSAIALQAGISSDTTAKKPEQIIEFEHFRYAGNNDDNAEDAEIPMLGRWADGLHYEPMEFGYDLTDLSANFDRSKPLKYFFIVNAKSGSKGVGNIYKCSFMNYEINADGLEIPFDIDTVSIESGKATMISVIVPGEKIAAPRNLTTTEEGIEWAAPEPSSLELQKYYIYSGENIIDSVPGSKTQYDVKPFDMQSFAVAAKYSTGNNTIVSDRSNVVTFGGKAEDDSENKVFNFKGGFFVMPDVLAKANPEATLEFWIKMPAAFPLEIGGWDGFAFQTNSSNTITFGWDTNTGNYRSSSTLPTVSWQHVAVVIKGNKMTLYVNGSAKTNFTSNTYSGISAFGDLSFGNMGKPLKKISIDEVRIWKKACTAREISSNMRWAIVNPTAWQDLLAYYKMDVIEENGVKKLRDCAHGHHAELINCDNAVSDIDNSFLRQSRTPIAEFTLSDGPYYPGEAIHATSNSYFSTVDWTWNAPDAGIENLHAQNIDLVFPKVGDYPVTLTVCGMDGEPITYSDTLSVVAAPDPEVDFYIPQETLPAGDHFSFINRSRAEGATYVWTLKGADVETVGGTNATAVYNEAGVYDVVLTAATATGSKSLTKQITVTASAPKADFTIRNNVLLKNTKAYLIDNSRYQPTEWLWRVSQGSEHTAIVGQNSSFTPTRPGYYDVALTATNETGSGTTTKTSAILVMNADPENGLYFGGDGYKMAFNSPFAAPTHTFSFEWWMNPSKLEGAISMDISGGVLALSTDEFGSVSLTNASGRSISSEENYVIANEWHHYAVVYSTGRVTYFRDGIKISSPTTTLGVSNLALDGEFTVGAADKGMNTIMDEFRVWNKAFTQANIQSYCNQPIANIDSAVVTDNLVLYYDFNQNGGEAIDRTAGGNNGRRTGFGPDGDAWGMVAGVFTLNFDETDVNTEDVTDDYMTNYVKPFRHTSESLNNAYNIASALELETDQSTWVMENEHIGDGITTAFHFERSTYALCLKTGMNDFSDTLQNHKLYQTVTLPAGVYHFGVEMQRQMLDNGSVYLIVAEGEGIPSLADVSKSLGYVSLKDGKQADFVLTEDTEVTLGLLANTTGMNNVAINSFYLKYEPVNILEADGLTSIYNAVTSGAESRVKPIPGGVRIVTEKAERITICDALGRVVFDEVMSGEQKVALPAGVYVADGITVSVR